MKLAGDKLFIIWEDLDDSGIYSCCEYDAVTNYFIVTVVKDKTILSESFPKNFSDNYSISISDTQQSVDIAEKLIKKLEKTDGSESNSGY